MGQILNFFISTASAAVPADQSSPQGGGFSFMIMLAIFFVFMYFAIWRPQSKRAREQQNLLGSLTKGDEIVTAGGMLGRISKIADPYITLTINNNVELIIQKSAVVSVLPKGTLKAIE